MTATFANPTTTEVLIMGGVLKYKVISEPQGSSQWYIHFKLGGREAVSRDWVGGMIEAEYVKFSANHGGYIATDKLREAV